jgi:hypothetical protein
VGRPKDPGSRRSKAERKRAQRASEAAARLAQKGAPNERVNQRREAFSFVRAERGGSIDQDVHDAIGQLHALELLTGSPYESKDLRDIGREYAELYWQRYNHLAPTVGQLERTSRATGDPPPMSARDLRFDRLDNALPRSSMERTTIHMLLTNHYHSDILEGWVQRLIDYEMIQRHGWMRPGAVLYLCSQTHGHDCYMLQTAIKGLCRLYEAGMSRKRLAA